MSATCLFCGGAQASPLTNEHINPRWLLEYLGLPADDQMLQGVVSSQTGALVEPPRVHSSFNFVQGHVCLACNGGWMRRLENVTKPLLVPLIEGARLTDSLTEQEAQIIGKWAAKTAYLHTWAGPMREPVQVEHLRPLCGDAGCLAPGVGVFAMQADYSQPSAYIQTGHWPQFSTNAKSNGIDTPSDAYKIGLQYRRLHLLVAFWPNPKSVLARVNNLHVRIFPSTVTDEECELNVPPDDGPIGRLKHFAEWLAVMHLE